MKGLGDSQVAHLMTAQSVFHSTHLFIVKYFILFLKLCACMCLCVCMYLWVWVPCRVGRRHKISPWSWGQTTVIYLTWLLETECRFSVRTRCALNPWSISSGQSDFIYIYILHHIIYVHMLIICTIHHVRIIHIYKLSIYVLHFRNVIYNKVKNYKIFFC